MKLRRLFLLLLVVCSAGCTISSKPIGGGYYVRTVHYFSWEPPGIAESLHFRGENGERICVWKNFTGRVLVEDSTAVFEGTTRPAGDYKLFAVQDGTPCIEVGGAILAFEAQRQNQDIHAFLERYVVYTSEAKRIENGFQLVCGQHGVNQPHLIISITWRELAGIMARVEAEGHVLKDKSGDTYLQIHYSTNAQR